MAHYDIVPTHLVVKAMRDSGYKNAAYAIAELMDNSIEAGATKVELLCGERNEMLRQRQRSRIHQIAVLDNGCGMDAEVLRMALQFGNGTRLAPENQTGIGRFGMGLPNSSVSQARRVDVWSWQNGIESALHSYIDTDEIERNSLREVPEPTRRAIPEMWLKVGKAFEGSGTLVVWSNIDRCMWRTARSIIENSELLIGRIYRFFINDGSVTIRFVSFDTDAPLPTPGKYALPNDPMYLMEHTSCPPPFSDTPMFEQWGDDLTFRVRFRDEEHDVLVRCAVAKKEAREGNNPGSLPHGQHARNNLGVSIVRAGRELDLDAGWVNNYDPTERWWGIEVHFPPALDDLFGVTNNKQAARNFSAMAKEDIEARSREYQTFNNMREQLDADSDPSLPLLEIALHIHKNRKQMREILDRQSKGVRGGGQKRYEPTPSEQKATEVAQQRISEGHIGKSDQQAAEQSPQQRQAEIMTVLVEQGVDEVQAEELAAQTVGRSLKFTFINSILSGSPAFFDVQSRGGSVIVALNTTHPAYKHLVEVLQKEVTTASVEELQERLALARDGLELLLFAWARYEDEQPDGPRRTRAQEARYDWGRVAREFLEDEEL